MNSNLAKINDLIGQDVSIYNTSDKSHLSSFTLINIMPNPTTGIMPEIAIVAAARTSFLGVNANIERDKKLYQYLYKHNHSSPSEMSEILFRMVDVDEIYVRELVEDQRWMINILRGTLNDISVKIDLNNLITYWKVTKSDPETNPVKIFLKQVIEIAYPWMSTLLNSDPISKLSFHPANEVSYGEQSDIKRYMMDDGYGDRWVEMHENTATDESLSEMINATNKDKNKYTLQDNIENMFASGDLRPMSMFSVKFALRAPVLVLWQLVNS